ncbi:MAG: nucleotidyltransferase substrate binding protein [bacterium]|jgi:nucleotidyltransferase substrate binding protein (TIGR01987 family)|nr:nucleotidyltransferase substrate binding protein [bacterium]
MTLNLRTLRRALDTLEYSLYIADEHMDEIREEFRGTIQAGIIHHFQIAYDHCWKAMQQWLRKNHPPERKGAPISTRKELFRKAALYGIISDPKPWIQFADAQTACSQVYDPDRAQFLCEAAEKFRPCAQELYENLQPDEDNSAS